MKMPTLLLEGYLVDADKELEEGVPLISHVRVGPHALAVDLHVDNPEAEDGEDVYAVLIPLGALYQLLEVSEQYLDAVPDMGQPTLPKKDLLN